MDVIRCDEPSYLIWKWHPVGSPQVYNNRSNAIRYGSSLRVKDGEVAVFVYNQENGVTQDFIVGPYDQIIETKNFPILANIVGLAYNGGTPFQAEVYFVNLAQIIQVKFGVPFFDVYDPRFMDFGVPVAVRGTIEFKISDYKEFIKLHRLDTFNLIDFQNQIRDVVNRYVKDIVANAPSSHDIPLVQIGTKIGQINDTVEIYLGDRLKETFGINISSIDISNIELDKTSEGYRSLISITKNLTNATMQAETQVKIKDIHDKQKIEAQHYEDTLRIQREEVQYAQHKQTQSNNMVAFQVEKQAEVGIASANALGQMGANGANDTNLNGGGNNYNMAAMVASMTISNAVSQNIAATMNNIMGGMNQQIAPASPPPPIPISTYYVAVNNQATGPFGLDVLQRMANTGQFTTEHLVWKDGMSQWEKAGMINELKNLFANAVPPIPS